ncbi:MAG: tetratricopeptide repeat protein [Bacteroidota bacterium]
MKLVLILTVVLQGTMQDPARVEADFRRYQQHQYKNYDSALFYLDRAIDNLAKNKRRGELLREKGFFQKDYGKFNESVAALNEAIQIFELIDDKALQAATYNNLGVTYWRAGDDEQALFYYSKSEAMNLKLGNKPGLLRNYIALGNYFAHAEKGDSSHQYESALENFKKALQYAGPADQSMHALALTNIGNIYGDTKFAQHNYDKAIEYYQQGLTQYEQLGDSVNIASLHVNIGVIYENLNSLDKAQQQYTRGIELQNRLGLKVFLPKSYLNLGNVFLKKNDVPKAKETFLQGIKVARDVKSPLFLHLANKLSWCFEQEKNSVLALAYLKLYDSANKHANNEQKIAATKEFETKYDTEKKQAEINLRTQQRDSVMITLIVVLVMTAIVVWIYSQRQKMVAQLRERDKTLMDKKVDELLRDQEIKSLRAYLNGQDEERKRLAVDLHDRLGSTLSATKLYFGSLNGSGAENQQSLEKASQLLDTAVEEVREISHNLLSGAITKFGLATALQELKETITNSNRLNMELFIHGLDGRLDTKAELHLYRIIQELVSNALKHANASEITVQLTKQANELILTVEDNGVGFDHQIKLISKGVGLQNVESRIQSLEGTMLIDSNKGNGTTILINIPLPS